MLQKKIWLVLDLIICVALVLVFGLWFFSNHAYGAVGDDAPGYIYTAGQLLRGESLVTQDALVQDALAFFKEERLARFVAPAHHEIISPDGWTVSRYPIGLSVVMAMAARLAESDTAMYVVVPASAVMVVLLTYLLGVITLPLAPALRRVAGLMAAGSVGLADVFANYAVAQPMREIPSIAFFLASLICIILSKRQSGGWAKYFLLVLSGACFGYSVNIRETGVILIIPLVLAWWPEATPLSIKAVWRSARPMIIAFGLGLALTLSLSIWHSAQITIHKEKFREKDISRIAITANFDHIQSLHPRNLFNNQGKFKPGVGGLQQYWQVMKGFNLWQPFLVFAAIGLYALWREQRRRAWMYASWFGLVYVLFAMWINPYPRYILPLLPAVALVSAYGAMMAVQYCAQWLQLRPWLSRSLAALLITSFFLAQQPAVAERNEQMVADTLVYKSVSQADLQQVRELSQLLFDPKLNNGRPPLLLMLGSYKGGFAETIMTHTNLRVIRFPSKPNEQPNLIDLEHYLNALNKTSSLFIWYDATASANEQRLLHQLHVSEPLTLRTFSFQPNVTVYAVTQNN